MILGIDIGGTNTDVAILEDGKFSFQTFRTAEVIESLPDFVKRFGRVKAAGIGVAVWFVDGVAIKAPNLPVIPEVKLEVPFVLDNDANCFAYYAAKLLKCRNLFGVTVGTGVGGGIIAEGKIYRGRGAAGEIGHTYVKGEKQCRCGGRGHLESYFGGWALGNAKELLESNKIYETEGFELFCISLANAAMLLNPEAIAIGGRIGGRLNEAKVKERVRNYLPDVIDIEIKAIPDDYAVAKGAALLALDTIS